MIVRELFAQLAPWLERYGDLQVVVRVGGRDAPTHAVADVAITNSLPHPCPTCKHTPEQGHVLEIRA